MKGETRCRECGALQTKKNIAAGKCWKCGEIFGSNYFNSVEDIASSDKLSFAGICWILNNAVPKQNPMELISKLKGFGFTEVEYVGTQHDVAEAFPKFDNGYSLVGSGEDSVELNFEILEKDSAILQAGFQIFYPKSTFLKREHRLISNHFTSLREVLGGLYGMSLPTDHPFAKIYNYSNELSVCYLSLVTTEEMNSLIVRVGNNKHWNHNLSTSVRELKKLTPKNRAYIIATAVSDYSIELDETIDQFLQTSPQYAEHRNILIDEAQWIMATGGLIAVRVLADHKKAKETYKQLIEFYRALHKSNNYSTMFTDDFLAALEKKFESYLVRFNRGLAMRDASEDSFGEALLDVANEAIEYFTGETRHSEISDIMDVFTLQERKEPTALELFIRDILGQFSKQFYEEYEKSQLI